MRKRILEYRRYMDELLSCLESGKTKEDIAHIKEEHLVQIGFFQHERLIHLLVTLAFAFFVLISASVAILSSYIYLLILAVGFLILLVPYIVHYFILENETQKLYFQYDELLKIKRTQTSEKQ